MRARPVVHGVQASISISSFTALSSRVQSTKRPSRDAAKPGAGSPHPPGGAGRVDTLPVENAKNLRASGATDPSDLAMTKKKTPESATAEKPSRTSDRTN